MNAAAAQPAAGGIPGHGKGPSRSVRPRPQSVPCPQDGVDVVFTVASMQTGCK
jgi:hypothetical protein